MFKCLRVDFFRNILFFLVPLVRPGFSGRAEGETIIFFLWGEGEAPPERSPGAVRPQRPVCAIPGVELSREFPGGAGRGGSAAAPGARLSPPPPLARRHGSARLMRPFPRRRARAAVAPRPLRQRGRGLSIGRSSEYLLE